MTAADSLQHTVHHPFAFGVGPLQITGFGLAMLMTFVIAQIVAQRELLRRGHVVESNAIPDLVVAAIIGGLVGAKLYYVLVIARDVREIFTREGFVFWGGLLGGTLLVWLNVRRRKLSVPRIADASAIALAAAYAVGRTGCWAVGDDYGRPWPAGGRLAVAFPDGAPPSTAQIMREDFGASLPASIAPDAVIAVHPTQLYEVAMGLVMFAVLWRMRAHRHADGWLFGVYMVLAGLERFVVEFLRAKDDRFFGPLTLAQVIAIAFAITGAIVIARTRRAPFAPVEAPQALRPHDRAADAP